MMTLDYHWANMISIINFNDKLIQFELYSKCYVPTSPKVDFRTKTEQRQRAIKVNIMYLEIVRGALAHYVADNDT